MDIALVLGNLTRELVVVVGASLCNVLNGTVAAVAGSLLDLGLLLYGGNDGFSDVAGCEVSIYSSGAFVDQIVSS